MGSRTKAVLKHRFEVDHEGRPAGEGERLPRAHSHVRVLRAKLEAEELDAAQSNVQEHPDAEEDVIETIDSLNFLC